mmetsp:Transcript_25037/g.54086  ORF Transcript_25037/g.54086 Transcript_25037/m.54086 type:complete len:304 (-) Transcript_25037:254-1165(-)
MLIALVVLEAALSFPIHRRDLSRRHANAVTAAAALGVLSSSLNAMAATDASLTDANGQFVVDPQKAANGLEDPLAEPIGAYNTISAALAVAPPGATILVRPGAYMEQLRVTRGVTLLADEGAVLTWRSERPYEAALALDLSEAQQAAQVLISGLSVRHFSPSIAQNYAVYVPEPSRAAAASRIELRSCDVSSSSGSGVGVEGGDVTLSACRVSACKNHGIVYVGARSRGAVIGCTVTACKLNGMLLRDGAYPTIDDNVLSRNGQFGAALIDCRARYNAQSNVASGNAKGGVSGECDLDDGAET